MDQRADVNDLAGSVFLSLSAGCNNVVVTLTDVCGVQKPVPFLEACHVEECAGRSSNYGTDKAKNHKFKRVRAVIPSKSSPKMS